MPSAPAKRLLAEIEAYGVPAKSIRLFGQDLNPSLQDYLSLDARRRENHPAPDGVAEYQGRPILYFVDEHNLAGASKGSGRGLFNNEPAGLQTIFQQLACRGERAYLARVQPGKLLVAPVSAADREPNWQQYTPGSLEGKFLFSRLALGFADGEQFAAGDAVFDRLFRLLRHAADKIARNETLRPDALSLVGRALFFRFLRDRGVLDNYPVQRIAPAAQEWKECFANAKNAADTCQWLDSTFNGDFLPLTKGGSEVFFRDIGRDTRDDVFQHLSAIIHGHEPAGEFYQPLLSWEWQQFDFAQIPVGLLSQVYEAFSWEWTPKEARRTSQRYTPRNIAITLLDEVLDGVPNATECRVLDPACGAGVFLVLAFRRLYREHWRKAGPDKRPGTADIRRILENQLVGMDISEPALRLAALSLYLTAIELDPEPKPPDKLKFRNLRGRVLHNVREPDVSPDGPALGSLSNHLGRTFNGKFDIVISNPPWTSVDKHVGARLGHVYQRIIQGLDGNPKAEHQLPDNNPDLPFLWKATEWCKQGGRIAMALPARILLRTEAVPAAARETLFRLVRVDGIINGTSLSDTDVWPKMNQPWVLLFATNDRPNINHRISLVNLPLDTSLNKTGSFRIDSESAREVDPMLAIGRAWVWKALSLGTVLDVEVIDKIRRASDEPLDVYWSRVVGRDRAGKGYKIAPKQKEQHKCEFLNDLPDLTTTDAFRFVVDSSQLGRFNHRTAHRSRKTTIYDPPLALVRQAPREDREKGLALLAFERLAYDENYNGYSAAMHPKGELLVRYLHLFIHSIVWQYYLLVTSPQFGAERRRAHKSDLGNFRLVPLERLNRVQRTEVLRLSKALEAEVTIPWTDIDRLFAQLYGLGNHDVQVMRDTLSIAQPYGTARQRACRPPDQRERSAFASALQRRLSPFAVSSGGAIGVQLWKPLGQPSHLVSPFDLVVLHASQKTALDINSIAAETLDTIICLAEENGATQIVLADARHLVIGIYNQYRYWTLSRARLLAADIIRYHLDSITG